MPTISIRGSGRCLSLALVSSVFVLTTAAAVHAQGSFFDMFFGVQPRPAPVQVQPREHRSYGQARARRHVRSERPKGRYAALPRPESVKADPDKITGKQPVDQKAILANPTAALLKDETLRAGDIVVMPAGPKVFTGSRAKKHRMSEFEDVKHSRLIDRKTRQTLLAMMVPVGAMPAHEARKAMAMKRKLAPPEDIAEVEAEARNEAGAEPTPLRVIVPWNPKP